MLHIFWLTIHSETTFFTPYQATKTVKPQLVVGHHTKKGGLAVGTSKADVIHVTTARKWTALQAISDPIASRDGITKCFFDSSGGYFKVAVTTVSYRVFVRNAKKLENSLTAIRSLLAMYQTISNRRQAAQDVKDVTAFIVPGDVKETLHPSSPADKVADILPQYYATQNALTKTAEIANPDLNSTILRTSGQLRESLRSILIAGIASKNPETAQTFIKLLVRLFDDNTGQFLKRGIFLEKNSVPFKPLKMPYACPHTREMLYDILLHLDHARLSDIVTGHTWTELLIELINNFYDTPLKKFRRTHHVERIRAKKMIISSCLEAMQTHEIEHFLTLTTEDARWNFLLRLDNIDEILKKFPILSQEIELSTESTEREKQPCRDAFTAVVNAMKTRFNRAKKLEQDQLRGAAFCIWSSDERKKEIQNISESAARTLSAMTS